MFKVGLKISQVHTHWHCSSTCRLPVWKNSSLIYSLPFLSTISSNNSSAFLHNSTQKYLPTYLDSIVLYVCKKFPLFCFLGNFFKVQVVGMRAQNHNLKFQNIMWHNFILIFGPQKKSVQFWIIFFTEKFDKIPCLLRKKITKIFKSHNLGFLGTQMTISCLRLSIQIAAGQTRPGPTLQHNYYTRSFHMRNLHIETQLKTCR